MGTLKDGFKSALPKSLTRQLWRVYKFMRPNATGKPVNKAAEARRRQAQRLVDSPFFDADFYSAQCGMEFDTPLAAARHFVGRSAKTIAWPHPLLGPHGLSDDTRKAWAAQGAGPLLDALSAGEDVRTTLSPVPTLDADRGAAERDDVKGLDFLTALTSDARLRVAGAVPPQEVSWGDFRRELFAAARLISRHEAFRAPNPAIPVWDEAREAQWIEQLEELADQPLVTVIMPAWNRERVIERAIESIQHQTYSHWELLVVDDGSTDATREIVERVAESDPRVRLILGEHRGAAAARNLAIAEARGLYLAFLDTDNTWRSHFLATMIAAMVSSGARFAYSAIKLVDQTGAVNHRAVQASYDSLLNRNVISMIVAVVDAELARSVGGFDDRFRRFNDHDFLLRVAEIEQPVLFPFVGVEFDDRIDAVETNRITTSEPQNWKPALQAKALIKRSEPRRAGVTSVIVLAGRYEQAAIDWLSAAEADFSDEPFELVIVDNGLAPTRSLRLASLAAGGRARWVRLPVEVSRSVALNAGIGASCGEFLILLDGTTVPRRGSLRHLVAHLADKDVLGAQALILGRDDLVASAGYAPVISSPFPVPLLEGRALEDAERLAGVEFDCVDCRILAVRGADLDMVGGFDGYFGAGLDEIDLGLRLVAASTGSFRVDVSVVVGAAANDRTRGLSLPPYELNYFRGKNSAPPQRPTRSVLAGRGVEIVGVAPTDDASSRVSAIEHRILGSDQDALRWGLRNPARTGVDGDSWGDTYFLNHLGEGLRQHGQASLSYRRGSGRVTSARFDDVNLVLRGGIAMDPLPGMTNIMWIISHPDDVQAVEIKGYDLVYAASGRWAEWATRQWGGPVHRLLQATDPVRFQPHTAARESGRDDIVFVGNARPGVGPRPIVMDAIRAGVPVRVWGNYWEPWLPAERVEGVSFPNDRLSYLYSSARVVLADHHGAMAADGFIANRLFDAVAAGARVVSDEVEGIDEVFDGAVQIYHSPDELAYLTSDEGIAERFPDDEAMLKIAQRIRNEHSFAARAARLVEDVTKRRSERLR